MIPEKELKNLQPNFKELAGMAAATGVSYFKDSFRRKGFDGKKWEPAKVDQSGKRRKGSLMVQSAALMNSIRAASVSEEEITWSAGNEKVAYAEVHNEGGKSGRGKGFQMPQRQFMGHAEELEEKITERFKKKLFKGNNT
ncbi:MAG: phage virion morphogenesis protein [Tannerellaceae bacterium]|nr:phage virion morphogenesis protein [Tannerellaceae bacterium]